MDALQQWHLYQLNVKNVFLNEYLQEKIYMEQSSKFVAQEESFGLVCHLHNLYMA